MKKALLLFARDLVEAASVAYPIVFATGKGLTHESIVAGAIAGGTALLATLRRQLNIAG